VSATRAHPRWATFAGVGVIGFGVQLAALALFTRAGLGSAPAAALAVEIAVLHNFAWHERCTWRDRAGGGTGAVLTRLARFHAGTGIVSLVGNVAITVAAVEWLRLPVIAANASAVALLSLLNFLIADRCVFQSSSSNPEPLVQPCEDFEIGPDRVGRHCTSDGERRRRRDLVGSPSAADERPSAPVGMESPDVAGRGMRYR
jgi:putative flippase GtrA